MSEAPESPLVLVADDDGDLLDLACLHLETAGYRVARARDGSEALRLAFEQRPELCVLDVEMPGLRGHEVLKALRADEQTRGIPVVLVTATLDHRSLWRVGPRPDDCMRKQSLIELESRVAALLGDRAMPVAAGT